MYKLICCNLSKSNRSLTNFTSTYRQVAQKYEKRHAKKKQFVSETDLQNVEEIVETPEAKAETIEEESSAETKTKSCSSFFTKNLAIRNFNYHLVGMDKYSQNPKLATSTSSNYYSSMANQNQYTTPKKKPFKNKEAMDMYRSALEQCMKIKVKKSAFDKLYRRVKLAPQPLRAASWEDQSKTEEQPEPEPEPEQKSANHFVYVYPEERLKDVKKEKPSSFTRTRPHIMNEMDYHLMRRKVKITYPTHLVKYKLGFNKSHKILQMKKKEEDEGNLFTRDDEIIKSTYPVMQSSAANRKFAQHSPKPRRAVERVDVEWQDVPIKYRAVEKAEKISKTQINKKQNKSPPRLKRNFELDYKDLLREGDELTAKENATLKRATERKKSHKSKVATYIEREETWSQPRIMVHPAVASKPLNIAEKYPTRYVVERNDNYDIENICVKNNENSTSNTKYGDYIVELDRGARMAEKETNLMKKLKVAQPETETKLQEPKQEDSVAAKEAVDVNATEEKVKEASPKPKGPAESLADYLKKLRELKDQTAVDRLNLRKPAVSEMVKKYEAPSKNPATKYDTAEKKTDDQVSESKPDPAEKEYRLLENPPQRNKEELTKTEIYTNVARQRERHKPGETNLECLTIKTETLIAAPKEATEPLERVETVTSKPHIQAKIKLPTRPIYSNITRTKSKHLLKRMKSEKSQLEIDEPMGETEDAVKTNEIATSADDLTQEANQAAQKKSMLHLRKIMNQYEVQKAKLQTEPDTVRSEIQLDEVAVKRINKRRRRNRMHQAKKDQEKSEETTEEAANDDSFREHELGGKGSDGKGEQDRAEMGAERPWIRMIVNLTPGEKTMEQSEEKGGENEITVVNEELVYLPIPPGETNKEDEPTIAKEQKVEQEQQLRNDMNLPVSPDPEKQSHIFKLDGKDILQGTSAPINQLNEEEKQQQIETTNAPPPSTSTQDKHDKLEEGSTSITEIISPLILEDKMEKTADQRDREERPDLSITKSEEIDKDQPSQIFEITSTTRRQGEIKQKYELENKLEPNMSEKKLLDKIPEATEEIKKEEQEQPSEVTELEKPPIDNELKGGLPSILPLEDGTVKNFQHWLDQRDIRKKQELDVAKEEKLDKDQADTVLEESSTDKSKQEHTLAGKELESNIPQEILVNATELTQESKKEDAEQLSKIEIDIDKDKDRETHVYQLAGALAEPIAPEEKLPFKRIEYVEKVYKLEEDSFVVNSTKIDQEEEDKLKLRENYAKLKEAGKHLTITSPEVDETEPSYELDEKEGTNRPSIRREKPKQIPRGQTKKKPAKTKKDMVLPSKGQNDPRIRNSSLDKQTEELRSSMEAPNDETINDSKAVSLDSLKMGKSLTGLAEEQKAIMLNEINEQLNDAQAQKDIKLNSSEDPTGTTAEIQAIATDDTNKVDASDGVQTAAKELGEDESTQLKQGKYEDNKEQKGTTQESISKKKSAEKEDGKTPSNPKVKQPTRDDHSLFAAIKDQTKRSAKEDKYAGLYAPKEKSSPTSTNYINASADEPNSKNMVHTMKDKKTDEITLSEGKRFPSINKRKYAKEYGENTKSSNPAGKSPKAKDKKTLTVTLKLTPSTIPGIKKDPVEQLTKFEEEPLPWEANEEAEASETPIKTGPIQFSDKVFSQVRRGRLDDDMIKTMQARENVEDQKDYAEKDTGQEEFEVEKLSPTTSSWRGERIRAKEKAEDEQDYNEQASFIDDEVEPVPNKIKATESEATIEALAKSESIEFSDNVFSKVRRGRIEDDLLKKVKAKENEEDYTGEKRLTDDDENPWPKISAWQSKVKAKGNTVQSTPINDEVEKPSSKTPSWLGKLEEKEEAKYREGYTEKDNTVQAAPIKEVETPLPKVRSWKGKIVTTEEAKEEEGTVKAKPLSDEVKTYSRKDYQIEAKDQKAGTEKTTLLSDEVEKPAPWQDTEVEAKEKTKDQGGYTEKTEVLSDAVEKPSPKTYSWRDYQIETKEKVKNQKAGTLSSEVKTHPQQVDAKDQKEDAETVQATPKALEEPMPISRVKQGFKVQQTVDGKTMVVFPYLKKKHVKRAIVDSSTIKTKEKKFKSPPGSSELGKKLTDSEADKADPKEVQPTNVEKKTADKTKFLPYNVADRLQSAASADPKMQRKHVRKDDKPAPRHSLSSPPAKKGPTDAKSGKKTKPVIKKAASSIQPSPSNVQETKSFQIPSLVPIMSTNSPDLKAKLEKIPIGSVKIIDEEEKERAKSALTVRPKVEKTLMTTLDKAKRLQKEKEQVNTDNNLDCCKDLLKKHAALPSKSLPDLNEVKWDEEKYAQALHLLLPKAPESTAQKQEKTEKKSKELTHTSKSVAIRKRILEISKKIKAREGKKDPVLVLPNKEEMVELGKKPEHLPPVKGAQKADTDIKPTLNSNAVAHSASLLESGIITDVKRDKPKTDGIPKKKRKNAQQLDRIIIKIDSTPVTDFYTPPKTSNITDTSDVVASKSLPELKKEMKDNSKEQPGKKIKVIVRDTKDPKVLIPNSYVSKPKDISPNSKCPLEHPIKIRAAGFNITGVDATAISMYTSTPLKPTVALQPSIKHVSMPEKLKKTATNNKLTKPSREVISNKSPIRQTEEVYTTYKDVKTLYVKSKESTERKHKGTIKKSGEVSEENLKTSPLKVNTTDNAQSAQKSRNAASKNIRKPIWSNKCTFRPQIPQAAPSEKDVAKLSTGKSLSKKEGKENKTGKNIYKPTTSTFTPPTPQVVTGEEDVAKLSIDKYLLKKEERPQFQEVLLKQDTTIANTPIYVTKSKKKRTRKLTGIPEDYFTTQISKELKKIDVENTKSKNTTKPKNKSHKKKRKSVKYALENYTNHNLTFLKTISKAKTVTNSVSNKPTPLEIKMVNKRNRKRLKGKFSVTSSPYLVQSGKEPRPIENQYYKELPRDHKKYSFEVIMERKEQTNKTYAQPTRENLFNSEISGKFKSDTAICSKNKPKNILLTYFHKYLVDNQLNKEFSKYLHETKYFAKQNTPVNLLPNITSCEELNVKQARKDDAKSLVTTEEVPEVNIKETTNNEAKSTSSVKAYELNRDITSIKSLDTSTCPLDNNKNVSSHPEDVSRNQRAQIKEILKDNYKEEKICKFNKNLVKFIKPDIVNLTETQEDTSHSPETIHLIRFWTPDLKTNTKKENLTKPDEKRTAELLPRIEISYSDAEITSTLTKQKELLTEILCSNSSDINSTTTYLKKQQNRKKFELLTRKERKQISYSNSIELPRIAENSNSKQLESANKCLTEQKEPRKAESLTGKETKAISYSNMNKSYSATKISKEQEERKAELLTRKERKRISYSNSNDFNSLKCLTEQEKPKEIVYSNSKWLKSADKCLTEQEEPKKSELLTGKGTKGITHNNSSKLNSAAKIRKEQEERKAELLTRKERKRIYYSNSNDLNSAKKCLTEQEKPKEIVYSNSKGLKSADKCLTEQEKPKEIIYSNSKGLKSADKCLTEQEKPKEIIYSNSTGLKSADKCLTEQEKPKEIIYSNSTGLKSADKCLTEQEKPKEIIYKSTGLKSADRCLTEQEKPKRIIYSNSTALKSADKCLTEQEQPKEIIYSNSTGLKSADKCLTEQEKPKEIIYSNSTGLKSADKCLTEQEKPKEIIYKSTGLKSADRCLTEQEKPKRIIYSNSTALKSADKCLTEQEKPKEIVYSNSTGLKSADQCLTEQEKPKEIICSNSTGLKSADKCLTEQEKPKEIIYSNSTGLKSADKCLTEQEKPKEIIYKSTGLKSADRCLTEQEKPKRIIYSNSTALKSADKCLTEQEKPKEIIYSNSTGLKSADKCLTEQEKPKEIICSNSTGLKSADKCLTEQEKPKEIIYSNSTGLKSADKCLTEQEKPKEIIYKSTGLKSADRCLTEQEKPKRIIYSNSTALKSADKCLTEQEKPKEIIYSNSTGLKSADKCLTEQEKPKEIICSNSTGLKSADKCLTEQEKPKEIIYSNSTGLKSADKCLTEQEKPKEIIYKSTGLKSADRCLTEQEKPKRIIYSNSTALKSADKCLTEQEKPKEIIYSNSTGLKSADKCLTEQEKPKGIIYSNSTGLKSADKCLTEQEKPKEIIYSNSTGLKSADKCLTEQEKPKGIIYSNSTGLKSADKCLTEQEKPKEIIYSNSTGLKSADKCLIEQEKPKEIIYSNSTGLKSADKCLTEQEKPKEIIYSSTGLKSADKSLTEQEKPKEIIYSSTGLKSADKCLTEQEKPKEIIYSSTGLKSADKCLTEQEKPKEIIYSNSTGLKSADKCLTKQEEPRKTELFPRKESKGISNSNSNKVNSATEISKKQEERKSELLTRETNLDVNSANKRLTEQEKPKDIVYSNSTGLKSADKCLTEQEEPRKTELFPRKESKGISNSNSNKVNSATDISKKQEERKSKLLTRETNLDVNSANKCLTEQEKPKDIVYSNSTGLKSADKCLTEQEEPRKTELLTRKETKGISHSNSNKVNSATEISKKQDERKSELLTRETNLDLNSANKCLKEQEKPKEIVYSNSTGLKSANKCLIELEKPRKAELLTGKETKGMSNSNSNKLNSATEISKHQGQKKAKLQIKGRPKISCSNSNGLNSENKRLTEQEKPRKTEHSNSKGLKSADKCLTEQKEPSKAEFVMGKQTKKISNSNSKISTEQKERKAELLIEGRKKTSYGNSNDLKSGNKRLTEHEKPRTVELPTRKETKETSNTKSNELKEARKAKSLIINELKDTSSLESSIRVSSITIEKTIPDRYQVVKQTPKRAVWGCNQICLPLRKLAVEALKEPIESATTLNRPISDNHRHIPNDMPDNLTKYKNMKITHMVVKRPMKTLDEHFLPSVLRGRKRRDTRQELKDLELEEEKAAMIALRYELIRKLHKQFCSLYGENAEKTKGNFEKVSKYYKKVVKNDKNEPEALPKAKPKAKSLDPCKHDPKHKKNIDNELENEKEACNVNFSLHPSKELRNKTESFIEKLAMREISSNKKHKEKNNLDETDNKGKPNKDDPQK